MEKFSPFQEECIKEGYYVQGIESIVGGEWKNKIIELLSGERDDRLKDFTERKSVMNFTEAFKKEHQLELETDQFIAEYIKNIETAYSLYQALQEDCSSDFPIL